MSLKIIHTYADYPEIVNEYVDFNNLDAFQSREVLNVIYGDNWESFIILDDKNVFIHTFSRNRINNSEYFDIEPFLGYSGPIVIAENEEFINTAIESYSAFCKKEMIIAEVFRFNPVLKNHICFEKSSIKISPAKEIVMVNCHKNQQEQLAEFNRLGKRYIKNIKSDTEITFYTDKSLNEFQKFYSTSLNKHNANKIWHFDDSFFKRVNESAGFILVELKYKDELKILSLIIKSRLAYYHFITSILEPRIKGLNEFLILTLSLTAAKNKSEYLILGGGNTSEKNDPLLLYKRNFNQTSTTFYIGKALYIPAVYNKLCVEFDNSNPQFHNSNIFLKYRLK